MVRYSTLPMRSYIRMAYRVNDYQVLGPDWLADRELRYRRETAGGRHARATPGDDSIPARG